MFPNKQIPRFLLFLYSVLCFMSHLKPQAFLILLTPCVSSSTKFHSPRPWVKCLTRVFLMDKVEGPRFVVASSMGGMDGSVSEWKWVWNKTFLCPLKFLPMPSPFSNPRSSSHLRGTFEIGWVITLEGVRLGFPWWFRGLEGLSSPKGEALSMGSGREEAAEEINAPLYSSLRQESSFQHIGRIPSAEWSLPRAVKLFCGSGWSGRHPFAEHHVLIHCMPCSPSLLWVCTTQILSLGSVF